MTEEKKLTIRNESSPAEMIRMAVEGKADLDKLAQLLAIQKDWEANEAKKAYVKAMTGFKADAPKVTKDKNNKQYNSKYTSLSNLVNTVNPVLSKHGLSASWDIEQNGIIKVFCRITHEFGHSEIASASAPADVSGAKNAIQQIKSTITYLKAVTFESICGLASTDANLDDDGQAIGTMLEDEPTTHKPAVDIPQEIKAEAVRPATDKPTGHTITEKQQKMLFAKCKAKGIDHEDFKEYLGREFNVGSTKDILMDSMDKVIKWINNYRQVE